MASFRSPVLLGALAAVFLGAVDLTIIATLLPTMIADLGVNTADLDRYIWVVNGYLMAYIVAIPLFGRLSDLFGRPSVFVLGLGLFIAGSILCATSDSLTDLIVARTLQGAGGGALLPAALALTADRFSVEARIGAVGIVTAVDTLGWVTGPLWGAAIVGLVPGVDEAWRWVFWFHVPLATICAVALFSRRARGTEARRHRIKELDVVGAALLAVTLVAVNLALASGSEIGTTPDSGLRALGGTPNPLADYVLPLLAVSIVAGAALVLRERSAHAPVLPIRLFRSRAFTATIVANALLGAALMVGMVNVPVVSALLVEPDDVSRVSALLLAPFTLMIATGSVVAGRASASMGVRGCVALGTLLVVVGYIVVAVLLSPEHYARATIGLAVAGIGIGLALAPLSGSALAIASAADRGAAASMALVARLLGMTVGISALTAAGVRRLQMLTERVEPIARTADESTAAFLERQRQFIEQHAIPVSLQVIGETFFVAAVLALLSLGPIRFLVDSERYSVEIEERSAPSASATDCRSL